MTELDASYLAGIIDGEGCISTKFTWSKRSKNKTVTVWLSVANTYLPLLEWVKEVTGAGGIYAHKGRALWKPGYHWAIQGKDDVRRVLSAVRPFLKIKAAQADLCLELLELKDARKSTDNRAGQMELSDQIRFLNKKGPSCLASA